MSTYIVDKVTQATKRQDKKVNLLNKTSLAWLVVHMQIRLHLGHHVGEFVLMDQALESGGAMTMGECRRLSWRKRGAASYYLSYTCTQ